MDRQQSGDCDSLFYSSHLSSSDRNEGISLCIDGRTHLKDRLVAFPSYHFSILPDSEDKIACLVSIGVEGPVINEGVNSHLNIESNHFDINKYIYKMKIRA